MSARTAATRTAAKATDSPAHARPGKKLKLYPFATGPFVDSEYSNRHSIVQMRSELVEGQEVTVEVEVSVHDPDTRPSEKWALVPGVGIYWRIERTQWDTDRLAADGHLRIVARGEPQTDGLDLRTDEVEAFATALYKAVQLAKTRGYLPAHPSTTNTASA